MHNLHQTGQISLDEVFRAPRAPETRGGFEGINLASEAECPADLGSQTWMLSPRLILGR